jgi:hypothetical protein
MIDTYMHIYCKVSFLKNCPKNAINLYCYNNSKRNLDFLICSNLYSTVAWNYSTVGGYFDWKLSLNFDDIILLKSALFIIGGSAPEASVNEMTVSGEASSLVLRSLIPGQVSTRTKNKTS